MVEGGGGVVGRGRGMKKKLPGVIRRDKWQLSEVGCVGLALAAGMRGLLPLPRSENGKQRTQTQPKTPRSKKGRTRIGKRIGGFVDAGDDEVMAMRSGRMVK